MSLEAGDRTHWYGCKSFQVGGILASHGKGCDLAGAPSPWAHCQILPPRSHMGSAGPEVAWRCSLTQMPRRREGSCIGAKGRLREGTHEDPWREQEAVEASDASPGTSGRGGQPLCAAGFVLPAPWTSGSLFLSTLLSLTFLFTSLLAPPLLPLFFKIEAQLIYSYKIILVSGVQHSDSGLVFFLKRIELY